MALQAGPQQDANWWLTLIDQSAAIAVAIFTPIAAAIAGAIAYMIRAARFEERITVEIREARAENAAAMARVAAKFNQISDRQVRWESEVKTEINDVRGEFREEFRNVSSAMGAANARIDAILLKKP